MKCAVTEESKIAGDKNTTELNTKRERNEWEDSDVGHVTQRWVDKLKIEKEQHKTD